MQALLKENKITLALAFPIITGQLSQMLIGLIDTLMIGRVGTTEPAAAALTNVIFNFPFVVGIGLFAAVSVPVAQAHGAGDKEAGEEAYRNGYLMSPHLWRRARWRAARDNSFPWIPGANKGSR